MPGSHGISYGLIQISVMNNEGMALTQGSTDGNHSFGLSLSLMILGVGGANEHKDYDKKTLIKKYLDFFYQIFFSESVGSPILSVNHYVLLLVLLLLLTTTTPTITSTNAAAVTTTTTTTTYNTKAK